MNGATPVQVIRYHHAALVARMAKRIMPQSEHWRWRSLASEMNAQGDWSTEQTEPWTAASLRAWARRHFPRPRQPPRFHRMATIGRRDLEAWEAERPRTRADCIHGPRPCPWLACVHHLGSHVDSRGRLYLHPAVKADDWPALPYGGCALDAAQAGPRGLAEIAHLMGTWKAEVVRIIAEAQSEARDRWSKLA